MNDVIQYAPLVTGFYLIAIAAIMSTPNVPSALLFRAVPMVLGVLLLLPYVPKG